MEDSQTSSENDLIFGISSLIEVGSSWNISPTLFLSSPRDEPRMTSSFSCLPQYDNKIRRDIWLFDFDLLLNTTIGESKSHNKMKATNRRTEEPAGKSFKKKERETDKHSKENKKEKSKQRKINLSDWSSEVPACLPASVLSLLLLLLLLLPWVPSSSKRPLPLLLPFSLCSFLRCFFFLFFLLFLPVLSLVLLVAAFAHPPSSLILQFLLFFFSLFSVSFSNFRPSSPSSSFLPFSSFLCMRSPFSSLFSVLAFSSSFPPPLSSPSRPLSEPPSLHLCVSLLSMAKERLTSMLLLQCEVMLAAKKKRGRMEGSTHSEQTMRSQCRISQCSHRHMALYKNSLDRRCEQSVSLLSIVQTTKEQQRRR